MKEEKYYTPDEVNYDNAGTLTFCSPIIRMVVAKALSKIPMKLADKVIREYSFITITEEQKGIFWPKTFFKNKNLIFISQGLLELENRLG